jgi:DNA (cytosine-5)-methyltransferase 1
MRYLSICSGIEAASVAFDPLGWKPLAFSEIEAFPRAVLQHHQPETPCHGDFTVLKDEPWIVDADMLCGGTPCQAFSVAGLRHSLDDDRGNLTLQFVLLADAIDHLRSTAGREPAWILWENVPGVLSTNDNAFGAFLGGLVGRTAPIPQPADGWTGAGVVDGPTRCAAWRIMDAQHFGLAQRRKRVFVLARGGAGKWAVADALLPVIEGSKWHPAPCRPTREGVAPTISARTSGGGGLGTDFDLDGGLIPSQYAHVPDCADTVTSKFSKGAEVLQQGAKDGGNCIPMLVRQVLSFYENQQAELTTSETAGTLTNGGGKPGQGYPSIQVGMQVRRLTPVECCRLQGFPDDYLDITYRGKPAADCPKYKALGNSWAVPVAAWIGKQIDNLIRK